MPAYRAASRAGNSPNANCLGSSHIAANGTSGPKRLFYHAPAATLASDHSDFFNTHRRLHQLRITGEIVASAGRTRTSLSNFSRVIFYHQQFIRRRQTALPYHFDV